MESGIQLQHAFPGLPRDLRTVRREKRAEVSELVCLVLVTRLRHDLLVDLCGVIELPARQHRDRAKLQVVGLRNDTGHDAHEINLRAVVEAKPDTVHHGSPPSSGISLSRLQIAVTSSSVSFLVRIRSRKYSRELTGGWPQRRCGHYPARATPWARRLVTRSTAPCGTTFRFVNPCFLAMSSPRRSSACAPSTSRRARAFASP